jgi:tetratricopeptide (TPR) repeat protein
MREGQEHSFLPLFGNHYMIHPHLLTMCVKLARRPRFLLALALILGSTVLAGFWLWSNYHLRQARLKLQQYHCEEARDHLSAYLQLWPHDVGAHLMAARAARRLEDFGEAEQQLLLAQGQRRKVPDEVLLEWALQRATEGNLEQAESYLLPLIQEDTDQALLACEALAEGYRRTYRLSQAFSLLDLWLKRRPDDVRALLLRGSLRKQTNNCQQATSDYRRVLELEPEREEALRGLASCLAESANWEEATPCWEELYRRHSTDLEVRVHLALCLSNREQQQQAQQMLGEVLEEHPDNLLALRSLGRILLQQQQPAEAEIWLRRAIRAAPQDYRSHLFLHQALQKQDKTAEAERELDEANRLELRWQRLHWIAQHELLTRPYDAASHAELGLILLDLGYEEAGRNWLLSALRCDPNCRPAKEALARLPNR